MSAKKRAKTAITIGLSFGIVSALAATIAAGPRGLLYAVLMVIMCPAYTFGYAFANWEKMVDKTGANVKYAFSGFLRARKLDKRHKGRTNYTLWAWVVGLIVIAWNIGMGWIPGIFRGIKALQEEKEAEAKKGSSKPAAPAKPTRHVEPAKPAPRVVPAVHVETPRPAPAAVPKKAPAKPPRKPKLRCTGGLFQGADFDVEAGEELLIGSDPSMCQIVLPKEIASPLHCSMYFDKDSNYWYVRDLTDGMTLENGAKSLKTGVFKLIEPGTTLSIGDGRNVQKFELA